LCQGATAKETLDFAAALGLIMLHPRCTAQESNAIAGGLYQILQARLRFRESLAGMPARAEAGWFDEYNESHLTRGSE
jgi:hypothetical protein